MDRDEEEFQFLGFFGILKESLNIIYLWRKIFVQITLSLILPLSFIFLAHMQISELLSMNMEKDQFILDNINAKAPGYAKFSDMVSSELATFWLFNIAYFILFLAFLLFSTSAVVYTIACIYTAKEISFKKVMSVVPKVWKRLIVTFVCSFIIILAYLIVAFLVLYLPVVFLDIENVWVPIIFVWFISYLAGMAYISLVWHLACIVSVLEDVYGFKAMIQSKALIKGKTKVALVMFLLLVFGLVGINILFETRAMVYVWSQTTFYRTNEMIFVSSQVPTKISIGIGILCLLLLLLVILFGLVTQTVLYFVCKSYHHENIDKSSLADHLDVYLGEYVPLKSKDIQLEQLHV